VKYVHIIPTRRRKEIILESIKGYEKPIQKAYFILSDEEAHKSVEFLKSALGKLIEMEKVYVDERDLYSTALKIFEIIL